MTHTRITPINRVGVNDAVAAGTTEDVWDGGGIYPWPTAAAVVRVAAGGNAADDAAGAGAQSVLIQGLDANFLPIQEVVATAGIAASANTTKAFLRIHQVYVGAVGTQFGSNVGAISIEQGGVEVARIAAGNGATQMVHYTTSALHKMELKYTRADVEANKPADIKFWFRNAAAVSAPKTIGAQSLGASGLVRSPLQGVVFPPMFDLWVAASADAGSATKVMATLNLELIGAPLVYS